jgi:hypothetical protein
MLHSESFFLRMFFRYFYLKDSFHLSHTKFLLGNTCLNIAKIRLSRTQHVFVVITQILSYLIVAFSTSVPMSLVGVAVSAIGTGLGENTYLALSAYYSKWDFK